MRKNESFKDLRKFFRGYRVKVHCFNCDNVYVTNLMHKLKMPNKCKYCGSIKIESLDYWEV